MTVEPLHTMEFLVIIEAIYMVVFEELPMRIYGVINMDVVGSRKIKDREQFQNRLDNYISLVYKKYLAILPASISITLGDEWQLITDAPHECYNLVHQFQQLLWPEGAELYAGIGIGDLSTSINDDIRKMDGTSFHMAREALYVAKRKPGKKSGYSGSKHNRVFFKSDKNAVRSYEPVSDGSLQAPGIDDIINTIIDNNEVHKSKMTKKQKDTYINYVKYGSYREMVRTQTEGTGGSIAAISQKLNTAEYFTIQHNHEIVGRLLKYICLPGSVTY